MVEDRRHRSFLNFIARVLELPAKYSKDDLISFRSAAVRQYPVLVPLLDEYIHLAEGADTPVVLHAADSQKRRREENMHLFDLLREKSLFPQNSDLVDFAARILPEMRSYRYDKMSKSDIAARMVEYLETLPPNAKRELEESMRSAFKKDVLSRPSARKSFLDTWERIIKGTANR